VVAPSPQDKDGTMTIAPTTLGIDVSGKRLDAYVHPGRARVLQ
jgi:hypothetical protein